MDETKELEKLNKKLSKEYLEIVNEILENNFNIEDGFIYQDSVYNPKEF